MTAMTARVKWRFAWFVALALLAGVTAPRRAAAQDEPAPDDAVPARASVTATGGGADAAEPEPLPLGEAAATRAVAPEVAPEMQAEADRALAERFAELAQ